MARIIYNKSPLDLDDRKKIGFDFPISGDAVFNATTTTREQTKANLINYLLTNKGERPFNPRFGADLRSLLFNVIDLEDQDDIRDRIQEEINELFPDVVISEIKFENDIDRHVVHFIITYKIERLGIEDDINISLQ